MTPTDDFHTLQIDAGNARGSTVTLSEDEFVIGRLSTPEGQLGDDPELSRQHARIRKTAGGDLEIEDLGSTNGTYVNDRRIQAPTRLRPGDVVEVGQTRMTVLDPVGRAAQPTAFGRVRPQPERQETRMPSASAPRAAQPKRPLAASVGSSAAPAAVRELRRPASPPWRLIAAVAGLIGALVGIVLAVSTAGGDDKPKPKPGPPKPLTVAELIKKGSPSTIQINTRGPAFTPKGKDVQRGGGTGIVIDADKGLVLTNAHVVSGQTSVKAKPTGGAEVSARVISQAPCEDLAVVSLRPNPPGLVSATLGDSDKVQAGDRVTALGYPSAFESNIGNRRLQASDGIVSASSGKTSLGPASPAFPDVIQHQAPLNGGNSGGPLFNQRGEVVGINTFASAREQSQNQNAAIAVNRAKSLLADLSAGKNSGYLGWQLLPLSAGELPLRPGTSNHRGSALVVLSVDSGSPADRRKFTFGDTIYEIDGTPVHRFQDVCDIVNSKASGDTVRVEGYHLPPLGLFGASLNSLQAAIVREALGFKKTIKLR